MQGRSIWTGRTSDGLMEVSLPGVSRWGTPTAEERFLVEPKHEAELRAYVAHARKWGRFCLVSVLLLSLICLGASTVVVVWPPAMLVIALATFLLGALVIAFPFATPETVAWLGIQRSVKLARVAGVLVLVLAAWMLAF